MYDVSDSVQTWFQVALAKTPGGGILAAPDFTGKTLEPLAW